MSKHQDTSKDTVKNDGKTGVSPHLAWETPQNSPNAEAKQKGQLGQNQRLKERDENKTSH